MEKLVSVIVPVYNTEEYLAACIDSVINQTYPSFELILVNDGSTDGSDSICRAYAAKDERIVVLSQENAGVSAARNKAMDIAKGEYIVFLDSDDTLANDALQQFVHCAQTSEADIVLCGIVFDHAIYRKYYHPYNAERTFLGSEALRAYLAEQRIQTVVCAKMYAADLMKDIRFPIGQIREDEYVMPEILGRAQKVVYIDQCLYVQRMRMGSIERSVFSEKRLVSLENEKHTREYVAANHPAMLEILKYRRMEAIAYLMWDIVETASVRRYKSVYAGLRTALAEEIRRVGDISGANRNVKLAWRCHPVFSLNAFIFGVLRRMKYRVEAYYSRKHPESAGNT